MAVDIEELRRVHFEEGKSAEQCAQHFGVSRSAILGLMFRNRDIFPKKNGLTTINSRRRKTKAIEGATVEDDTEVEESHGRAERIPNFDAGPKDIVFEFQTKAAASDPDETKAIELIGKTLMELGDRECRHVINDVVSPRLFCGEPGYPYCKKHIPRKAFT